MKKKAISLFIIFFFLSQITMSNSHRIINENKIFSYSIHKPEYEVTTNNNKDYNFFKIKEYLNEELQFTEYVGLNKTSQDIEFTQNRIYIGSIIPIAIVKFSSEYWLIPLRYFDTVLDSGFYRTDTYVELYYSATGNLKAYRYEDFTQTNIDVNLNRLILRIDKLSGTIELKVNVTIPYSLEDTGFGFLFRPLNPQDFRYISIENKTYDILQIQKITDLNKINKFMNEQQKLLKVKWNWQDLYNLGANHLYEILQFDNIKGFLCGSIGFGINNTIILNSPSFSVTQGASEITIENKYDLDTNGYRLTFLVDGQAWRIDHIYDYETSAYAVNGDTSDYDSYGITNMIYANTTFVEYLFAQESIINIIEDSDTRIILNITERRTSGGIDFWCENIFTFYSGLDIFLWHFNFWHNDASNGWYENIVRIYFTDVTQDDYSGHDRHTEDNSDRVYSFYNDTESGFGFIWLDGSDNPDNLSPINNQDKWILSCNGNGDTVQANISMFDATFLFGLHSLFSNDGVNTEAYSDELDNEISDDFLSLTSTLGATYNGRNNITGGYYFTHSSGNNITFDLGLVDSESNFTVFHIDNWNKVNYTLLINNTIQIEDSDFYAYYNSTSLDLDIVVAYPLTSNKYMQIIDIAVDLYAQGYADGYNASQIEFYVFDLTTAIFIFLVISVILSMIGYFMPFIALIGISISLICFVNVISLSIFIIGINLICTFLNIILFILGVAKRRYI